MRRNLVAQAGSAAGGQGLDLAADVVKLALQYLDLFLLAENRPVQGFDQILGKGQLDLKFLDPSFNFLPFNTLFHSPTPFQ